MGAVCGYKNVELNHVFQSSRFFSQTGTKLAAGCVSFRRDLHSIFVPSGLQSAQRLSD